MKNTPNTTSGSEKSGWWSERLNDVFMRLKHIILAVLTVHQKLMGSLKVRGVSKGVVATKHLLWKICLQGRLACGTWNQPSKIGYCIAYSIERETAQKQAPVIDPSKYVNTLIAHSLHVCGGGWRNANHWLPIAMPKQICARVAILLHSEKCFQLVAHYKCVSNI